MKRKHSTARTDLKIVNCLFFCSRLFSDGSFKGKKKKGGGENKENQEEAAAIGDERAAAGREPPRKLLEFCERFMEFLIDLLCQLPTRFGHIYIYHGIHIFSAGSRHLACPKAFVNFSPVLFL